MTEQGVLSEQAITSPEKEMSTSKLVSLIVGINLFILITGGGLIWWLTLEEKPNFNLMKRFEKFADNKVRSFGKVFKRKPKEVVVEKKPSNKEDPNPEFMDLSLPKE